MGVLLAVVITIGAEGGATETAACVSLVSLLSKKMAPPPTPVPGSTTLIDERLFVLFPAFFGMPTSPPLSILLRTNLLFFIGKGSRSSPSFEFCLDDDRDEVSFVTFLFPW